MTTSTKTKKEVRDTKTHRPVYKIDATDMILGRLATQIASLLRGKNDPHFEYRSDKGGNVVISNAAKIKTTGKKMDQKVYYRYSGYPGGLKERKMSKVFEKNPSEVLKMAVYNMLPKNKLRDQMIKRLTIKN